MEQRILIVDDEPKILTMVETYLNREGFKTRTAKDGREALRMFEEFQPHVLILDLLLPGMKGLDVCKEIRKESTVPIIMLTAKTEEIDKLLGLELGADDYITKPFSLKELTARVRAVLRRTSVYVGEVAEQTIIRGDFLLNPVKREVKVQKKVISLTPTEYNVLFVLAKHPGRPYSRLQLLDMALDESFQGYERVIDTHVSNLRKKIEPNPLEPIYIKTVYGLGYKFGEQL